MRTFHLIILRAEDTFCDGEAEIVEIPTTDGMYGIKAFHENIVFSIVPGLLRYRLKGEEVREAFVSSGMLRMENNEVIVLVETAEYPDQIDEARARQKEAEAREVLLQKKSRQEYILAEASLVRAIGRIKVKNRYRR